jgi:acyl carrier protein
MTRTEIESKTIEFLSEEFEVDKNKMTPDASLKETLNLDSLDYVDLVIFIESHFGFKVKPDDFTQLKTFNDFYSYIEQQLVSSGKTV